MQFGIIFNGKVELWHHDREHIGPDHFKKVIDIPNKYLTVSSEKMDIEIGQFIVDTIKSELESRSDKVSQREERERKDREDLEGLLVSLPKESKKYTAH